MPRHTTRREFVGAAAWTGIGVWLPRIAGAQGRSPNELLNFAFIGLGGQGGANLGHYRSQNVVALCDADERAAGRAAGRAPKAKIFRDYRKMFDAMAKEIDVVVVSTPDHHHAPACIAAMRLGKHIYVEKPLAHNIAECRKMADVARQTKVVTQMGNMAHASYQYHRAAQLIKAGVLGKVTEYHCAKRLGPGKSVFPDALKPGVMNDSGRPKDTPPVPANLDWDLWLGPAADRPYHPSYHPFTWRGWRDFGTGGYGDFCCHVMDPAFMALDLKYPTAVEAAGSPVPFEKAPGGAFRFSFPARPAAPGSTGGDLPPVIVYWHGEGSGPPADWFDGESVATAFFVGEKGRMLLVHAKDGLEPKLLPKAKFADVKLPEPNFPRSPGHHAEFLHCIRNGGQPGSNIPGYAVYLGEAARLGHVAFWAGGKILWDGPAMRVTEPASANAFVGREYRKGWEI